MQSVRMRENAKVIQLNIPAHKVDAIKHVQKTLFDKKRKNSTIKSILGHSLCCLCSGVPSIEVSYDLGGFRKIEMYCQRCISQVYQRDEPQDRDSLAKKYGIIAVDSEDMPRRDIYKTTD